MNRYARLRRHKRYLKQRHANARDIWNIRMDEQDSRASASEDTLWNRKHPGRNGGYEYWHNFYLSGCRKFAKYCTNRHIRAKYRQLLARNTKEEYLEDVVAPTGADYEKEFDYLWTIW